MPDTPAPRDALLECRSIIERIQEPHLREVLLRGNDISLLALTAQAKLDQAALLVEHWKRMPEHITGAAAIRGLSDVLAGGFAPGAPRPKKGAK